jgi:hypothetical protein
MKKTPKPKDLPATTALDPRGGQKTLPCSNNLKQISLGTY